jgi:hypothetical protein
MNINTLSNTPPWDWPEDAGATLKEALRNRRLAVSDRILAAELAGDLVVMDDQMAEALLSVVRDAGEPEDLRAKAAVVFGAALEQTDIEGFDDDELSEPPLSEQMFDEVKETLRKIHADEREPKIVRRRALEASVRARQDWHADAVRAALSSKDEDWKLTAVFAMQWVSGFDDEIMKALESKNPDIHYQAVSAAGEQRVDAAWAHVVGLVQSKKTEKPLLLAAIEAIGGIRPVEARPLLTKLANSDDEEIAEVASEALMMAEMDFDDEDEEEDEDSPR